MKACNSGRSVIRKLGITQLKAIGRDVRQFLGFPFSSHQFYQVHLCKSLNHGPRHPSNHRGLDTKNTARKSPITLRKRRGVHDKSRAVMLHSSQITENQSCQPEKIEQYTSPHTSQMPGFSGAIFLRGILTRTLGNGGPCKPSQIVSSVQFSHSVMSNSLRPHGLQHTRPPCPSLTPRAYSNSCPLSR